MSSQHLRAEEEEEASLEMLRMAALNSMSRNKDQLNERQKTSERSNSFVKNKDTNSNHISNKFNKSYYNISHRNHCSNTRNNLIVLTNKDIEESDNKTNNFTQITNTRSDCPEKRKRVLPGRFSRLERDDTDEDSDECSDDCDDNAVTISAFNKTSDEEMISNSSDNTTNNGLISLKTDSNKTNESIVCPEFEINVNNNDLNFDELELRNGSEDKDQCLATTSTNGDNDCNTSYAKHISNTDRKEKIRLHSNNDISKSDVLKRRKQKFGQTVAEEVVNDLTSDSTENTMTSNKSKTGVKSRLTIDSNLNRNKYPKNLRVNQNNGNKELESSHRHQSNARKKHSNNDFDGFDDHSSKKRLRSLVVMK